MTLAYDAFDKATRHFEAYAILLNGKAVGRVVIKYGNAATAFVQVWGAEMVIGRATGYGYDKATAAVEAAATKLRKFSPYEEAGRKAIACFDRAFADKGAGGARWPSRLEAEGLTICNVIG